MPPSLRSVEMGKQIKINETDHRCSRATEIQEGLRNKRK
jgi:hypothetical protein